MTLTAEEKKSAINAKRGPLDHEKYAAELDVKTAEASGQEELMEEPRARLARIEDQLKVLDDAEAKID